MVQVLEEDNGKETVATMKTCLWSGYCGFLVCWSKHHTEIKLAPHEMNIWFFNQRIHFKDLEILTIEGIALHWILLSPDFSIVHCDLFLEVVSRKLPMDSMMWSFASGANHW